MRQNLPDNFPTFFSNFALAPVVTRLLKSYEETLVGAISLGFIFLPISLMWFYKRDFIAISFFWFKNDYAINCLDSKSQLQAEARYIGTLIIQNRRSGLSKD